VRNPRAVFVHDLPHDAALQAVARMKPFSLRAAHQKVTVAVIVRINTRDDPALG
jgi:hypothetical protein